MSNDKTAKFRPLVESYPRRIIFLRWLLLAIEAGLGAYFVFGFRMELGILYIAYGVVSLFLLLPLIRCVRCYYYGKRCNFGWGSWVSQYFPQDSKNPHSTYYGYTILFWPLRIIPLILGIRIVIITIAFSFQSGPQELLSLPIAFYLAYLVVMALHRRFYMSFACNRCHQRDGCPVFDSRAALAVGKNSPQEA